MTSSPTDVLITGLATSVGGSGVGAEVGGTDVGMAVAGTDTGVGCEVEIPTNSRKQMGQCKMRCI